MPLLVVERWRSETLTFHFLCGEAIIILENVAIVIGVSIERSIVTAWSSSNLEDVMMRLLRNYSMNEDDITRG